MHRLVVALVTLIGLTGVAVVAAYLFLFSASTDRAAGLAPADTAFYANVYLQPSTGQQMNLSGLIGRLPGFADEASLDEKVDQIVQNLLAGTGVDYRAEVKTWLGDQVALAAWPTSADPAASEVVVIADVKDREAAETAIADLASDGGSFSSETYSGVELHVADGSAYAFVEEMLVIGPAAEHLQAVVDASVGESLADRPDFRAAMDGLPADHLASFFVDLAGIADTAGMQDQLEAVTTASGVLVAERDGLRLSGSAPLEATADASAEPSGSQTTANEPSTLVDWMPDETVAEVVIFGLRSALEEAEAAAGATPDGEELMSTLDTLRAIAAFGLGIDIDADLLPLLDREVAVAVSGLGEAGLPAGQLLLAPEDPAAAADALDRLVGGLSAVVGSPEETEHAGETITTLTVPDVGDVSYAIVDGVVILSLGADGVAAAIDAHADGASLGATEAYRRTFEVAGMRAGNEAYVDVTALVELLGADAELPADARDILLQIGSFGLTAPARDDQIEFHAVLTVDEPSGAN